MQSEVPGAYYTASSEGLTFLYTGHYTIVRTSSRALDCCINSDTERVYELHTLQFEFITIRCKFEMCFMS